MSGLKFDFAGISEAHVVAHFFLAQMKLGWGMSSLICNTHSELPKGELTTHLGRHNDARNALGPWGGGIKDELQGKDVSIEADCYKSRQRLQVADISSLVKDAQRNFPRHSTARG